MGVNINEDKMISKLENQYEEQHGEPFAVSHMRESLRKLKHIPYYGKKFEEYVKIHGDPK